MGSVTWRQKKEPGKAMSDNCRAHERGSRNWKFLGQIRKYFHSGLSLRYTGVRGSALGRVHPKEETANMAWEGTAVHMFSNALETLGA